MTSEEGTMQAILDLMYCVSQSFMNAATSKQVSNLRHMSYCPLKDGILA